MQNDNKDKIDEMREKAGSFRIETILGFHDVIPSYSDSRLDEREHPVGR